MGERGKGFSEAGDKGGLCVPHLVFFSERLYHHLNEKLGFVQINQLIMSVSLNDL